MGGSYSSVEPNIPKAAQDPWNQLSKVAQGYQDTTKYPGQTAYTGQFTAPMTSSEKQGLSGLQSWATQPSSLDTGTSDLLSKTMSGYFLNEGNPYLQQMSDAMGRNMSKTINQQSQDLGSIFSKAGVTYRGPAEQKMRTSALQNYGDSLANLYGQNYQNERGIMQQAVPYSMQYGQNIGDRYSTLMGAGAVPRSIDQYGLDQAYKDYGTTTTAQQEAYMNPWNVLSQWFNQMPLAYPQQNYNKGPLDYGIGLVDAIIPG